MSTKPEDTWQTLGSAALRVVVEAERQRRVEKQSGAVPAADLQATYVRPQSEEMGQGEV